MSKYTDELVKCWVPGSEISKERVLSWLERESVRKASFVNNTLALWEKAKNWEAGTHNQIIVFGGEIVGMHLASWNVRNPYLNSYCLYVSKEYQGLGVGGALFDWALQVAKEKGNLRWKCVCDENNAGLNFYRGFGLSPVARNGKDFYFDFTIKGCGSISELIEASSAWSDFSTIGKKDLEKYRNCSECWIP